jgi:hypothetical protein
MGMIRHQDVRNNGKPIGGGIAQNLRRDTPGNLRVKEDSSTSLGANRQEILKLPDVRKSSELRSPALHASGMCKSCAGDGVDVRDTRTDGDRK